MNASSFLRRSALSIALLAGVGLVMPSISSAAEQETCRKKRSKRISKKEKRALAKMKREGRVTTKQIRLWQKRKLSNDKIVKLAYEIGYEDSAKRQKFLRKYKVRKSLRKALAAGPKLAKAKVKSKKPSAPEPIDLDATIDPEEIDFDSVPPPEGAEMATAWVSEDEEQRKKQKRVMAKPSGKRRVVVSRK